MGADRTDRSGDSCLLNGNHRLRPTLKILSIVRIGEIVTTDSDELVEAFLNVSVEFPVFSLAPFHAKAFDEPIETDQVTVSAFRGMTIELVEDVMKVFVVSECPFFACFIFQSFCSDRILGSILLSCNGIVVSKTIFGLGILGVICGELDFQEFWYDTGELATLNVVVSLVKTLVCCR